MQKGSISTSFPPCEQVEVVALFRVPLLPFSPLSVIFPLSFRYVSLFASHAGQQSAPSEGE